MGQSLARKRARKRAGIELPGMNTVLLGATKGMGRALARRMAARGDRLFLLGRDAGELDKAAADLRGRAGDGVVAGTAACDLADPATFGPALDAATAALGKLDTVVVSAALFGSQDELEADPARLAALLSANFGHTILFCEEARKRLLAAGGGTLCVFSSVAGDRGRKPVILYGATKAGLSYYLEGLDHKFSSAGLRVVTVKPAPSTAAPRSSTPRPRGAS
jgi:decaprenylphospho-beta-D-erythro-pentofuranosid-2-ulose 2-reductase